MTPQQKADIQHASKVLTVLQQKVDAVLKIAPNCPNVDRLDDLKLSNDDLEKVKKMLIHISIFSFDVKAAMSPLLSEPLIPVKNKQVFEWYKKNKKFVQCAAVLAVGVSKKHVLPDDSQDNYIWDALDNALNAAGYYLEGLDDDVVDDSGLTHGDIWRDNGLDIDLCRELINKPYFKPDSWKVNAERIGSIVVTQPLEKIPTHVKQRVHEIHYSFVFNNPMATIALSRCLLEFVILDKKSLLKKEDATELYNKDGRVAGISKLADVAANTFPELKHDMEYIIESGNQIMHPRKKVRHIILPKRAEECVNKITRIVGTLYSHSAHH